MRILLIGDPFGVQDIGERKVVRSIYQKLCLQNEVFVCKPRDIKNAEIRDILKKFKPEIIHYWAGPRLRSFIVLWLFKKITGCKKTFITAIRTQLSIAGLYFAKLFKPTKILVQSNNYQKIFEQYGFKTLFFPNGIHTKRFTPVDAKKKNDLRSKYKIPQDKFVVTHIGHVTPWRSLEIFSAIAENPDYYVLIIASTSLFNPDEQLFKLLQKSGCDIRTELFDSIEEVYQLSDCYIFPGGAKSESRLPMIIPNKNNVPAIEIPLTVLEAMSCNIPIITSRFGGVADIIKVSDGAKFIDDQNEIIIILDKLKREKRFINNRDDIMNYDWDNLYNKLITFYRGD